jgi:hypothetical protein
MKFLDIIKQYKNGLLVEQGPGDVPPPPTDPTAAAPAPTAPAPATPPPAEPAEPDQVDEPAGIVAMGNLLKKALTLNLDDGAKLKISQLPEVNEKNASKVINQIVTIMKTYTSDIDIGTD